MKDGCKYFSTCDDCLTDKCYVEFPSEKAYLTEVRNITINLLYQAGFSPLTLIRIFNWDDMIIRRAIK